jgi:CRP-like cAMP-binding protein
MERIEALLREVRRHAQNNEILKAAAVCKQILAIDPHHAETRRRILALRALHENDAPKTIKGRPLPRGASWTGSSGAIDRLSLSKVMTGTGRGAGVYEISLDDEVEEDVPLHLSAAEQPPPAPVVADTSEVAFAAVEEEFRAAEATNAALMSTAIFTDLSPKTFGELLLHARLIELEEKKELFKQGDPGDALYVIAEGSIGVIDEGPPRRGITKLKDGDLFGELALMTDEPRTATIVALKPSKLIEIDRAVIKKLIASDDQFLTVLLRFFRDRSVERLLSTNPLFTALSSRDREALKTRFRFLEVDAGALLVEAGKLVGGLVILLSGRARAERNGAPLGDLGPGDVCGEISLMTKSPATANVRATAKCIAIELPGAAFTKIVEARPEAKSFVEQLVKERSRK